MKIADGYLLGEVAGATLRGLGWFGGLLTAFAVIAAVRRVADGTITTTGMIEMIMYSMPRILLFTLPMSVLYGTVQAFTDLSAKGEVSALWAGGMGLVRMLRAPLMWALLLAVLAFWVQEAMVPMAEREKKNAAIRNAQILLAATEDFHWAESYPNKRTKREISADRFDPKSRELTKPIIRLNNADGTFSSEILADRAVWNQENGKWKLYNVKIRTAPKDDQNIFTLAGEQEEMELNTEKGAPNPKLLTAKELGIRENLEMRNFEMVSIGDLGNYIKDLERIYRSSNHAGVREQQQQRIKGAIFGIHDKIATPLIVVALVLIGVPLGIRPQRSGSGFAMGVSLVVVLLYYVLWTWVSQVGKAGFYNPVILAYLPLIVILAIAIGLVRKKS